MLDITFPLSKLKKSGTNSMTPTLTKYDNKMWKKLVMDKQPCTLIKMPICWSTRKSILLKNLPNKFIMKDYGEKSLRLKNQIDFTGKCTSTSARPSRTYFKGLWKNSIPNLRICSSTTSSSSSVKSSESATVWISKSF